MPRSWPIWCVLVIGLMICACDRSPKLVATTMPTTVVPSPAGDPNWQDFRRWGSDFTLVVRRPAPAIPTDSPSYWSLNRRILPAPPRPPRWPGGPRTDPPLFGGWLTWLEAEVECERLMQASARDQWYLTPADLSYFLSLTQQHPSAATLFAMLGVEHPNPSTRGSVLISIGQCPWLHTPEVRQVIWNNGEMAGNYFDVRYALLAFGSEQLRPLDDEEFLRQLDAVIMYRWPMADDDFIELYLREAIRRKSKRIADVLSTTSPFRQPELNYLLRLAHNRCLDQPDPLTLKATPSPDDPRLIEIELSLTDPELKEYELQQHDNQPTCIDVLLQSAPDRPLKPWTEKWPPSQTLKRGQPYHTSVYLGMIRGPLKVRVALRLFSQEPTTPPPSPLLPGPRLMPSMFVDLDVPASAEAARP